MCPKALASLPGMWALGCPLPAPVYLRCLLGGLLGSLVPWLGGTGVIWFLAWCFEFYSHQILAAK